MSQILLLTLFLFTSFIITTTVETKEPLRPISLIGPSYALIPESSARESFRIWIREDSKQQTGFKENHFVLKLSTNEWLSETIAQLPFHSSYGKFNLTLVDLTGDNIEEFILVTGEGRGTNVRKEFLTVFRYANQEFQSLLNVPVSRYFGVGRWWYEPEYVDISGDGLTDLQLVLKYDPPKNSTLNDPSLIPTTKILGYVWDLSRQEFILSQ